MENPHTAFPRHRYPPAARKVFRKTFSKLEKNSRACPPPVGAAPSRKKPASPSRKSPSSHPSRFRWRGILPHPAEEKRKEYPTTNWTKGENNSGQREVCIENHFTEKSPPPFAAHFAEIEVDTWTGRVEILKYVSTIDCGTPINPIICEGQTEGGTLNGISYALTEEYLFNERGKMTNASFAGYHIFSMRDKPPMETIICPSYEETGPFGAKSVSEICINGAAPVFANAIYNATGARLYEFPLTPEKVYNAIQAVKR